MNDFVILNANKEIMRLGKKKKKDLLAEAMSKQ